MHRRRLMLMTTGIAVALLATLTAGVIVFINQSPGAPPGSGAQGRPVADAGPPPPDLVQAKVEPLKKRNPPHLLAVGEGSLSDAAVAKVREIKGVKAVEVVDAGRVQVGSKELGVLGVDPSSFRAFAPKPTAEADDLWRNVADGDVAVSFGASDAIGSVMGEEISIGGRLEIRVGAHAEIGVSGFGAVISRERAREVGLQEGNALLVSADGKARERLKKAVRRHLPKRTQLQRLTPATTVSSSGPELTRTARSRVAGDRVTPRMRRVREEIDAMFGPFSVIGCYRPGDPQDHGTGRACDFMVSPLGQALTPKVKRRGDRIAAYVVANARRLGIKYIIWRQYIWNIRRPGWRLMGNRGSNTQNHMDHPHISVL